MEKGAEVVCSYGFSAIAETSRANVKSGKPPVFHQDHLPGDFRAPVIEGARQMASLKETIGELNRTLSTVRETLDEADRVLFLYR